MELAGAVRQVKANLRAGRFTSERAVSQGAVLPILQALGWPVFDPIVVAPEYRLTTLRGKTRRPDYALCRNDGQPFTLIEVKAVGRAGSADEQLFEYCYHAGVPFAILTDGQEWRFYLTMEVGSYDERCVYKLDLLEQDDSVCCERLERYLLKESVTQGGNIANARNDFDDSTRNIRIQSTLPQAWSEILATPDNYICEMLAAKVSNLCGFEPDVDTCTDFIKESATVASGFPAVSTPQMATTPPEPLPAPALASDAPSFVFRGRNYPCQANTGVMVALFNKLAELYPDFLERYAARKQGYSRRFLSQDKYELYPGQTERCESHSVELDVGGWFVATHQSRTTIETSAQLACEILSLRYGSDIILNLRSRTPTR